MQRGFTLVEIVIATAIVFALAVAIGSFAKDTLSLNRDASGRLNASFAGVKAMRSMVRELRSASFISATSSDSLAFFAVTEAGEEPVSIEYSFDAGSGSLVRISEGDSATIMASLENASVTPVFAYDGTYIEITLVSGGKERVFGVTPRNIESEI